VKFEWLYLYFGGALSNGRTANFDQRQRLKCQCHPKSCNNHKPNMINLISKEALLTL